ncbi:MAG: hypothetical protein ACFBSE_03365 [Prochloraceae cyanobacterium]
MQFLQFLNLLESGFQIDRAELWQWLDIIEKEVPQESNCCKDSDPQQMSYEKRRELVSSSCTYLGLKEIDNDWLDGVDDLADILGDLQQVKWCLNYTSLDDAKWHYRFYYYNHFQKHIISIRKILKCFE